MPQEYKTDTREKIWLLRGIETGMSIEYGKKKLTFLTEGEFTTVGRKITESYTEKSISDENSQQLILRALLEWKEKLLGVISLTPGAKYEWIGYRVIDNRLFPQQLAKTEYLSTLAPKIGLIWSSLGCDIFASLEQKVCPPKHYEKAKNVQLMPEKVISVECGSRVRVDPLNGSISVFYIDFQNQIIRKGITFENSREGTFHQGIEGKINWRLTSHLSLFLNHTYIEARFHESRYRVPEVPESESNVGVRLTYMPTYSLVITYNYRGKSYIDEKEHPNWIVNPYGTLDFYFKIKLHPSFSIALSGTNFTNTKGRHLGYKLDGKAMYYPIPERGFRIEGSFEF
jgi:hypothetical protein